MGMHSNVEGAYLLCEFRRVEFPRNIIGQWIVGQYDQDMEYHYLEMYSNFKKTYQFCDIRRVEFKWNSTG